MHCLSCYITKTPIPNQPSVKVNDAYLYYNISGRVIHKNKDIKICHIQTNYFGGLGDQGASVSFNGKMTKFNTINEALKVLGFVNKDDKFYDLFEWVGLHKYRDNESLLEDIIESLDKGIEVAEKRSNENKVDLFKRMKSKLVRIAA